MMSKNTVLRVYVCDLANELYEIDNKTIPIGAGYVAAYCKKRFGDQVEVKVFRTFKKFWEAAKAFVPDVVGFGSYDWNHNLTLKVAKEIKKLNPGCAVLFGGANAEIQPEANRIFLTDNPDIDFVIYGDGEYPFSNVIENIIGNSGKQDPIDAAKQIPVDGARALVDKELIMGKPMDTVTNMDEIPSPYLTGLFDELLNDKILMPIIQNIRGCPYECRYCVSGTQSGKIRQFPFERFKAEFEYLKKNAASKYLRLSDDNFGIVESDVEIAEYIRESFEKNNYPVVFKAYSAKRQNDHSRLVATILKPLMTYCISLQTTTPGVLKDTKRTSATHKETVESLEYAREHDLPTGTELIFGLPGETLDSWKEVINKTVGYRFNSIQMQGLWLLKGSDLNRAEVREEMQYRSKFMLAENAVTISDEFFSIEKDEIVVQSKYYSFDEWKIFLKYQILVKMLLLFGYGRELIYYALNIGVQPTDLFDVMTTHSEEYPNVCEFASDYVNTYTGNMFDTEEELISYVEDFVGGTKGNKEGLMALGKERVFYKHLTKNYFDDKDNGLLKEIRNAIVQCYEGDDRSQIEAEADFVLDLALKLIINPRKEFFPDVVFEGRYDAVKWVREGYSQPLSQYLMEESRSIALSCRNSVIVKDVIQRDKEQGRTDCFHFFRYMNSSFMRRCVDRIA
jgi:radical SAM superfamily enzyme YgiQ (UPF0313 family)